MFRIRSGRQGVIANGSQINSKGVGEWPQRSAITGEGQKFCYPPFVTVMHSGQRFTRQILVGSWLTRAYPEMGFREINGAVLEANLQTTSSAPALERNFR